MADAYENEVKDDEDLGGSSVTGQTSETLFNPKIVGKATIVQTLGTSQVTVNPSIDLQSALDGLKEAGGGTLFLEAGTYYVNGDLNVYSNIRIEGNSAASTTISFGGTNGSVHIYGDNVYTAGTLSVNKGSTSVTGSSTTWTSDMVGRYIFISDRWYLIAAVVSTTSITLASAFADANVSGGAYRIAEVRQSVEISDLTITGSTAYGIETKDMINSSFEDLVIIANGFDGGIFENSMNLEFNRVSSIGNGDGGLNFLEGSFINIVETACISNTDYGMYLESVKISQVTFSASNSNGQEGYLLLGTSDCYFIVEASGNTQQGIDLDSACNNNRFIGNITGNTLDGIRLLATSDTNIVVNGIITGNGGYGVNVAAASCDNTVISSNIFSGNSSGAVNDSGTGTVIRGNVGATDNSTGSSSEQALFGDGSDGALTITSGTTTINLGGAKVVVKNYSSISITGSGTLGFSNPHTTGTFIILKNTGNTTLTSSNASIDASGMGADGASAGADGTDSSHYLDSVAHRGESGIVGSAPGGAKKSGGPAGAVSTAYLDFVLGKNDTFYPFHKINYIVCGAGGGGGGRGYNGSATGGVGGNGGGALMVFTKGDINFTGSIDSNGADGGNGTEAGSTGGGGGGGGSAGIVILTYGTATSVAGSINVDGGNGGDGAPGSGTGDNGGGGSGGGGASVFDVAGGAGGDGAGSLSDDATNGSAGSNGEGTGGSGGSAGASSNGGNGGGGGGGAGGYYAVLENSNFFF